MPQKTLVVNANDSGAPVKPTSATPAALAATGPVGPVTSTGSATKVSPGSGPGGFGPAPGGLATGDLVRNVGSGVVIDDGSTVKDASPPEERKQAVNRRWLLALLLGSPLHLLAQDVPLANWLVPSASPKSGPSLLADATFPIPFIGLPPCRLVDTRGNGAPITGGAYIGGEVRSYDFAGLCGIPSSAKALSLNVTVTQAAGGGFITVWPKGGALPTVSTVNYVAGQTIANAAIVPTGGANAGVSFVAGVSGTHLVVDVNGYFSGTPATANNYLHIVNSSSIYSIGTLNGSLTCTGPCGVRATIQSNADGANAVEGSSTSATGHVIGVRGISAGTGDSLQTRAASAGVLGEATSTTGGVHGVRGVTDSSDPSAAAIAGSVSSSSAMGAYFENRPNQAEIYFLSSKLATVRDSQDYGLLTNGDVKCSTLVANTKNFVAPHPEDASKEIVYVSVEAPQADIYFRGTARLEGGVARIPVPEHFRLSARPGSYMTTAMPVGLNAIPLSVEAEGPDGIVVRGRSDVTFHYVVYAEREAFKDHDPTPPNVHFVPEALAHTDPNKGLPASYRESLIRNGTLNPDGTFNRETAARFGWAIANETAAPSPPPPSR